MDLMKIYLHSKWTSIKKVYGWRHYEVSNVFIKNKEVELFSVCDKQIKFLVKIKDLKNNHNWKPGWNE